MASSRVRPDKALPNRDSAWGGSEGPVALRSDSDVLRALAVAAGLSWAVAFVVVGLGYGLQMYGDGSIFSYAVAVQDAWAFHWRNISGRLFVYLFLFLPAETYVALTGDARGGIAAYGLLWFATPLAGLAATFAVDRSQGRLIFAYACASTGSLCPLVFGFPTELWATHAVFWPALAICHYARAGMAGFALVFALLLALVLTHEGGLIFALAILATLLLQGPRDATFLRAAGAFGIAMMLWTAVKLILPPDDYFGSVVVAAALKLIDPSNLTSPVFLLLLSALVGYGIALFALRRLACVQAPAFAVLFVAVALAVYWLWFDQWLHTGDRYELRTALLIGTPVLGAMAGVFARRAEGRLNLPVPLLPQATAMLANPIAVRAAIGTITVVMLVHAVETAKFVTAWANYKSAVRALATGTASDPALGDARFVSSARIGAGLNRLSWSSTTPYLSVLLAPAMAPARLVVDPEGDYFWLSCATASARLAADRAIPAQSRRLVRAYNCLHR